MSKCQAIATTTGEQHNSTGSITITHGDHKHIVCKIHTKATQFSNCSVAEKIKPIVLDEQQSLPIANTDGLKGVTKARMVLDLKNRGFHNAANRVKGIIHDGSDTTPRTVMTAPVPEVPKLGVHCHKTSCKETTDVRGFFCCGNHGCDHS